MHIHMYIYIYIYIERERDLSALEDTARGRKHRERRPVGRESRTTLRGLDTANLRTNIMDSRGFDSSIILIRRGGIPRPNGNFPEILSQAILVGIILVGRLGVCWHALDRHMKVFVIADMLTIRSDMFGTVQARHEMTWPLVHAQRYVCLPCSWHLEFVRSLVNK